MYRLLVTDDEPLILESYHDLLQKRFEGMLRTDLAPTAENALLQAQERIDILVTDIYMPGMNGFDLQREVHARWPESLTIFLTANGNVHNVQKAIRSCDRITDFVLKIEEDESLIAAVEKAIERLDRERVIPDPELERQNRLRLAMPLLRREFFLSLVHHPLPNRMELKSRMEQLHLPLSADQPICIVYGRASGEDGTDALFLSLDNLMKDYLQPDCALFGAASGLGFVWMIQSEADGGSEGAFTQMVHGRLLLVREMAESLLDFPIRFLIGRRTIDWSAVRREVSTADKAYDIIGGGNGVTWLEDVPAASLGEGRNAYVAVHAAIRVLEEAMSEARPEAMRAALHTLTGHMACSKPVFALAHYEISLTARRSAEIGRLGAAGQEVLHELLYIDDTMTRMELLDRYADLFSRLLPSDQDTTHSGHDVIGVISRYVRDNPEADLSLTAIAERFFVSPTYLSKLFKRTMGIGYCKYVTEQRMQRARELIRHTTAHLDEVSCMVGFDSPSYFSKIFKKLYNLTPIEYREQAHEELLSPSAASRISPARSR